MTKVILILTGFALFIISCTSNSKIPEASPKMAKDYQVAEATLARGRGIYMAHCGACHERIPPGKIDPESWRGIVPHMALNSKISKKEELELLQYLMAAHGTVHGIDTDL